MTTERQGDGDLLGRRAARSSVWVVAGFATSIALRLVSSVVLTRFIHPEIYGLMDLVTTLIVAMHLFSDIGIIPCIVQSPRGGDPRHLNTVWTMQLVRNILILGVVAILAVPLSKAYHRPILALLLPAIAFSGVLECLQSTGVFVLNRQVRRGRLVTMEFLTSVITLAATISAIYVWNPTGFRAVLTGKIANLPFDESLTWTIVVGATVGKVGWLVLSYLLTPGGAPRFDWQRETVREVFGFGRWVFASTILQFLAQQTDRLIAPKISDFQTNGLYGRALGLVAMGTGLIENLASSIVFPTISRAVEHGADPTMYAERVGIISKLVSATLLTGLFVTGPSIVHVLYPETYADVGWIVQALSVVAWFQCQSVVAGAIMLGVGKPAGVMFANGMKLAALVIFALPAAYFAYRFKVSGIIALIAVVAIGEAIRYVSYAAVATRMKLWRPLADVGTVVALSLLGYAIMLGGKRLTLGILTAAPHSKLDWVISMFAHGGLVVLSYGAITAVFWRTGRLKLSI